MVPSSLKRRLKLASIITAGLAFAPDAYGQGTLSSRGLDSRTPSKQTAGKRIAVTEPKPSKNSSGAMLNSNTRAPVPSTPTRTQPVRVAHSNSQRAVNPTNEVETASCKSCQSAAVQIAQDPMETVFEEPSDLGWQGHVQSPNSYRFHGADCDSCDSSDVIHPLGVLAAILRNAQIRVEAATFWGDGQTLPPLVTTRRPANDPSTDGLIGRPDTIPLFGGKEMLSDSTQGVRGELGLFFDPCRTKGVLLRFFDVSTQTESYNNSGTAEPVVMRPFFSTANNAQASIAINYPGSTSGSVNASLSSELYGGNLLFRRRLARDCGGEIEFLTGYQMVHLSEDLSLVSSTTALSNSPAPLGTVSQLSDRFETENRFYGASFGLQGKIREGYWSLQGMVQLGVGNLERLVDIAGSSTITVPGTPPTTSSTTNGLLARNTNDGHYEFNTFVVSPEAAVTLGYRISRRLEATLTYTYLGLPKVARAGDQLDPDLASNLNNPLTGTPTPRFNLVESNLDLHSLSYGLQWQY